MRPLLIVAAVLVAGCPSAEPEPAEPADVAGFWSLTAQPNETDCVGAEWDFWVVWDFVTRTPNDVPAFTLDVSQTDGALTAALEPGGCTLAGTVGPTGTFQLSGACDTASMDRDLTLSGNAVPFGADLDIDGNLAFDVDADDGAGGGPDGTIDCSVSAAGVSGSGTPD